MNIKLAIATQLRFQPYGADGSPMRERVVEMVPFADVAIQMPPLIGVDVVDEYAKALACGQLVAILAIRGPEGANVDIQLLPKAALEAVAARKSPALQEPATGE
jgi:nitrate reductase NapE component